MHEDPNGDGRRVEPMASGSGVDQEFPALERELTVFLRRARASSGEMAREVHPDLESSAYGLLFRLEECGRQRATELAAYIGVGKATMSRQLRALEDWASSPANPTPPTAAPGSSTSRRRAGRVSARCGRRAGRVMCGNWGAGTRGRSRNWRGCCIS